MEKDFSDPEYRLWRYLLRKADWDTRHKNYGKIVLTYNQILYELPWSKGKLSNNVNKLRGKKLIECQKGIIKIMNLEKYLYKKNKMISFRKIEQGIQDNEQGVQPDEFDVQNNEQKGLIQILNHLTKETINKNKENLIKRMDMSKMLK